MANFLLWQEAFRRTNPRLIVAFLNIGQGDAVYIEAPNGNQMLIDAGGSKSILRELGKIMPFYDRSIDAVVATHPDKDHLGGFQDVLEKYKVDLILESGVKSKNTKSVLAVESAVKKKNIYKLLARRGMRVDLGGGAIFQVFFPDRDVSGVDTNDGSIVGKLIYGGHSFLLTGDSPQKIEEYLVEQSSDELKSDVLKAGHHGSPPSASRPIPRAGRSAFFRISAGDDNV